MTYSKELPDINETIDTLEQQFLPKNSGVGEIAVALQEASEEAAGKLTVLDVVAKASEFDTPMDSKTSNSTRTVNGTPPGDVDYSD